MRLSIVRYSAQARMRSMKACLQYSKRNLTTSPLETEPPALRRMRSNMKDAMRSKDTNRLDVLRGLLAAVTNESKTGAPVDSDAQVLTLLKKKVKATEGAIRVFDAAKRADLRTKEEAQLAILNEYINSIPTASDEDGD